ncbi:hypothetical protein RhiirA5_409880 [Rhizophagus irregularis]|uniref:Uncharacterized protein n=1 Tax=Rhizophagus irregularis TaxID=588596 RepID=A0A2N0Q4M5_9GLOM|nr:hypothetical protein RhiirA5_409880 [Rhizophagus irregularis]CAB5179822.1 unnamed protein product [Rhizophagus irregularis]
MIFVTIYCNFIYPSIDVQQRNYPRLYPLGNIPCIECQNTQDSNAHIGTCTEHSDDIKLVLDAEKRRLITILIENLDEIPPILESFVHNSPFFNINFDDRIPITHPVYLMIHNLVPCDLSLIFYNFINNKKLRFSLFIQFITVFMQQIDDIIWKKRNTKVKSWERSLSITKNKKRFYHRHHRKRNSEPSTDHLIDAPPLRSYTHRRFTITPYFREGGILR